MSSLVPADNAAGSQATDVLQGARTGAASDGAVAPASAREAGAFQRTGGEVAASGLDTGAEARRRRGLRSALGTALAVVLSDPALWVLGTAGFLARGGWLVFVLPIWTLPSPVAITTLLGADVLGTGRVSAQLVALLAAGLAVIATALVASAVAAVAVDVAAFEHFVRDPETLELRRGREARQLSPGERIRLILGLVGLLGLLLVPAATAVMATALRMIQAAYQDFLLPGSLDVPLALRVLFSSWAHVAVLVLCLLGGELLASVASRQLLAARFGLGVRVRGRDPMARRSLRGSVAAVSTRALRIAATWMLAWLVTLGLLVPGLGGILLGWAAVRSAFLDADALRDVQGAVAAGPAAVLFVALWCGALLLAGFGSAVRAALWTAESMA
jgi:hypothetical protein